MFSSASSLQAKRGATTGTEPAALLYLKGLLAWKCENQIEVRPREGGVD
jgi:hypothetical protein